jgi:hypothetical protein
VRCHHRAQSSIFSTGSKKAQTDPSRNRPACFQKSVVESFAISDAVAVAIEAHAWNEDHVDAASFDKLIMPGSSMSQAFRTSSVSCGEL